MALTVFTAAAALGVGGDRVHPDMHSLTTGGFADLGTLVGAYSHFL
jgi:hypothetical protein